MAFYAFSSIFQAVVPVLTFSFLPPQRIFALMFSLPYSYMRARCKDSRLTSLPSLGATPLEIPPNFLS